MKNSILFTLLLFWLYACSQPDIIISIDPGDHDRIAIPIQISLNDPIDTTANYHLKDLDTKKILPVEIMDEMTILTFADSLKSNSISKFKLVKYTSSNSRKNTLEIIENQEGIQVKIDKNEVLYYQKELKSPPSGESNLYAKSGFIHPLKSPNGATLTDDFPKGHLHQHAIYNAWTNTTFKGKKVDFWNQLDSMGTVNHKKMIKVKTGQVTGQIKAMLSHISLENGEILEELWEIRIYPVSDFYMFDLYSEQTNTSKDTLFLNKYIYGGMALRGSREWNPDDSINYQQQWKVLSDQGKTLENVNHTQAKWISVSGNLSETAAGVTVFGFPDNFRYPQFVRVHPTMPYWVFTPVFEEGFSINPGETYKSKFRYVVHNGEVDKKLMEMIQLNLENPVKVSIN
ncbi:PmoA family protein [Belliella kenyensis]|uniref:PmoA family protein n=1 Tax=Belliella kenyensis TaxID=1472724 RepID=A0ABV8EM92_9BACT|nr:PmoA family protein [Belliella kenyensis]MCH7400709.1 PmoA family protein [Belliella kenyensis]MDN3602004.1 PmoA family protein [Belliella kenyensis]